MAILGATSLTGCDSIPDFIGANSRMVFHQNSAPAVSWTKETDVAFNNIALRVIGGSDGTALSPRSNGSPFTTVFIATKGLTVPLNSNPAAITIQSASGYITAPGPQGSTVNRTSSNGSAVSAVSATTITAPTMRTHFHPYTRAPATLNPASGVSQPQRAPEITTLVPLTSGPAPSPAGGSHTHTVSDDQHNHPMSPGAHAHPVTDPGHNHTFTMTQRNFDITYVDIIICRKN